MAWRWTVRMGVLRTGQERIKRLAELVVRGLRVAVWVAPEQVGGFFRITIDIVQNIACLIEANEFMMAVADCGAGTIGQDFGPEEFRENPGPLSGHVFMLDERHEAHAIENMTAWNCSVDIDASQFKDGGKNIDAIDERRFFAAAIDH